MMEAASMTIGDIAKMAGVSRAAVSRYLNNGYVSAEKKERIRLVIEETGFKPSFMARTLRTKKTCMIGVVLPRIHSDSISRIVAGIGNVLNSAGYEMLLSTTDNSPERELDFLKIFSKDRVDGVILLGTVLTPKHIRLLSESPIPVVVLGQKINGCTSIYHSDRLASRELTELILGRGRRHIGFIGIMKEDVAVGYERHAGYEDALSGAGLSLPEEYYIQGDFSLESGYSSMEILYSHAPALDAVICATDSLAVGALMYLKNIGKSVPADMMLAGFGDNLISGVTTPSVTTVHFYYWESGELAAGELLTMINEGRKKQKQIRLGYELIVRESVSDREISNE